MNSKLNNQKVKGVGPYLHDSSPVYGQIHSIETCGMVDGPGIRYVIFMQGCPLRCLYCHNPDALSFTGGKAISVDEVVKDISKYKSYISGDKGGVTISGGEPLAQIDFVREVFERCEEMGIHTTLDTSGFVDVERVKDLLEYVNLVLLDIKSITPKQHIKVTGFSNEKIIKFANYLKKIKKPIWIRFVLVPGLTDDLDEIKKMEEFLSAMDNVEKIEVLPFHKMGEFKWKELGYEYKLKDTPTPTKELVEKVKSILVPPLSH